MYQCAFARIRDQAFHGDELISFVATGLLTATTELCGCHKLIEELIKMEEATTQWRTKWLKRDSLNDYSEVEYNKWFDGETQIICGG